ncbi:unnamed protein product [Cuscuta campestris]|uniref:Integrase catalytic domain-containing protein n=1 Tax=Cuscuta campestris TaxID=132261 RepID=A0A484LTI0_9ASTE|nr:unnamed protein product [Cuscuta campestris]
MTTPTTDSPTTPPLTMEDLMKAINNLSTELQATKLQVSTLTASGSHAEPRWNKPPTTGWHPPVRAPGNDVVPRIRVEAPHFNGDDPAGWIFRIHNYFDYFQTPEGERLQLVAMLIDYPASDWFRYYQTNTCGTSWEAFLIAVRQRFDPDYYENYIGSLSKLQQSTTREVNLRNPRTLQEAFGLARELSACHNESSSFRRPWSGRQPVHSTPSTASATPTATTVPGVSSTGKPSTPSFAQQLPIVKVTTAQKNERSKKGLCWYCDDKWVPGHHCKGRFLAYMGPDDDDDSGSPLEDDSQAVDDGVIVGDVSTLNSLAGSPSSRALKLVGTRGEHGTKTGFGWNEAAENSFQQLKHAMVTAPILRLPNFGLTFYLETDASDVGIGAVLLQQGHPLAFFSKKLGPRRRAASTYHKELYAIAESVHKWRQYLLGREFVIRSEQKSLKDLLCQVIQTPDQQFYIRKLMGFKFRIEYKPGASNKVADALSRRDIIDTPDSDDTAAVFLAFAQPIPTLLQDIRRDNALLQDCQSLHSAVQQGTAPPHISLHDGMLYYKHRIYISPSSSLRTAILHEFHSTPIAGHQGVDRTFKRVANVFYWRGMQRNVRQFVAACVPCQATKYSTQRPAGLLQPLPIPTHVWDSVSMDFITGLPPSRGFTMIMVVMDRLSKYTHFGLLQTGFDAPRVANLFLDTVVKHHGFPSTVILDRDSVFMSSFWRELMKLSGTTLKFSTTYHPQTDGQTEVMNRGLEQYLRAFTFERPHKWDTFLPWAELALNCSHHDGLNMSPYQALYGRTPPHLFPTLTVRAKVASVEDMLRERAAVLEDLRRNLAKMQQRMRERANLHRRDVSFTVGDYVLLKLQQHWQHSLARPRSSKLARRYYGPFEVLERIGSVAYRLRLPAGCKIHDVFHVSLLWPFVSGGQPLPEPVLLEDIIRGQVVATPVSAGPRRTVLVNGQPQEQCLVRWSDDGGANASWEPVDSLRLNFPSLDLEDKAVLNPGGDDTGPMHVEAHAGRKFVGKKHLSLNKDTSQVRLAIVKMCRWTTISNCKDTKVNNGVCGLLHHFPEADPR